MKTQRCKQCGKVTEGRITDFKNEACRCNPAVAALIDNMVEKKYMVAGILRSPHPRCTLCGGIITLTYGARGHSQYCGVCDR